MQHIGIILQNEQGQLLKDSGINFTPILEEIYKIDNQKKSSSLLWMIDPFGNTTFNSIQTPIVISQLQSLIFSDENKATVSEVVEFLDQRNTHEYICFIGD